MSKSRVASVLHVVLSSSVVAALVGPRVAEAASPDTRACVAAFDRGQRARTDRSLRRAERELIVCAQETCPVVLRADCAGVLAQVQAAIPSVVFVADDGMGHDRTDVRVLLDGEVVASALDGRAVPLDPGTFTFRFETQDGVDVSSTQTIREGEKNRVLRISIPPRGVKATLAIDSPSVSGVSGSSSDDRRSAAGWAVPAGFAAVGVAGLALGGYFRLRFDDRTDELRSTCAPNCSSTDRDDLSSTLVSSNVALGVGIGALALAAASWWLFAPSASTTSTTGRAARTTSPGVGTWRF